MEGIISALITGGLALLGVVLSNMASNKKVETKLQTAQAVTDVKIEELTREVRLHNDFGNRIPVLEEKIKSIENRLNGGN